MNESWENSWTKIAESPSLTTREALAVKEFDGYDFFCSCIPEMIVDNKGPF